MEFHNLRKGLIARTLRVTSCAGAAGVGSVFGMAVSLSGRTGEPKGLFRRVSETSEAKIPLRISSLKFARPLTWSIDPL